MAWWIFEFDPVSIPVGIGMAAGIEQVAVAQPAHQVAASGPAATDYCTVLVVLDQIKSWVGSFECCSVAVAECTGLLGDLHGRGFEDWSGTNFCLFAGFLLFLSGLQFFDKDQSFDDFVRFKCLDLWVETAIDFCILRQHFEFMSSVPVFLAQ